MADWSFGAWQEYLTDAAQRTVLTADVMRERGNQYLEHMAETVPHVLSYDYELVVDGRTLEEPVNYALLQIPPAEGVPVDERARPFVVVDPRAGHGPGIGGFKADSEIGVILAAGHPCYFVGFSPNPEPGQTIEKVIRAKGHFVEEVARRHPKAEGKPALIGNCQGGWALMMLAAVRPELVGPIIVAGSPLSYWAGVRGENPMRYTGGLLGGSWLTALTGDMGNGIFDGAWLVHNFENLNPANTLWGKQYNLYKKIDTEGPRYLGFERWWGGHVMLNAEEMQSIVDELFVGNHLSVGDIVSSDGVRVDLRHIRSPIVVFCSKGDNITPPQQALGWILDLYDSVEDIQAMGQTIVYTVHESIGHLGIFVSGGVAKKEHREFAHNIDLIDTLPPGLYEAVMEAKDGDEANEDLAAGDYISRFEMRTLDDIRALGGNDEDDERAFEAVARTSEINHGLYRTTLQPLVRAMVTEEMAAWARKLHPARIQYEMLSDQNPLMRHVAAAAREARENRRPASPDNPFLAMQESWSKLIMDSLDGWRDFRDAMQEQVFFAIYGNPMVQALLGLKADDRPARRHPGTSPEHLAFVEQRIEELRGRIESGGLREAAVRSLVYVRMPTQKVDERGFELLRRTHDSEGGDLDLEAFKTLVREQFFMLLLDERRAVEALPKLVAGHEAEAAAMLERVAEVATVSGSMNEEATRRLEEVRGLIGGAEVKPPAARRGRPRATAA